VVKGDNDEEFGNDEQIAVYQMAAAEGVHQLASFLIKLYV
jgi:hypothetical protein